MLAQQQPGSGQLHQWLDHVLGAHAEILNQTVTDVHQNHQAVSAHASNADVMKQDAISAENEFVRIVELLRSPPPNTVPAVQGTPGDPSRAMAPTALSASAPVPGGRAYAVSYAAPTGQLTPPPPPQGLVPPVAMGLATPPAFQASAPPVNYMSPPPTGALTPSRAPPFTVPPPSQSPAATQRFV